MQRVTTLIDDLGEPVELPAPPTRIVSLVPSITEALAASVPARLVGATEWCTRPADLDVTRVRGTKNPDRAAIGSLHPDLVVANQEENRELDVRRLREAGVPVWVTRIETLDNAFRSLHRLLVDVLGLDEPAWLRTARAAWAEPARGPRRRAAIAIWRDPWMVVGPRTFTGDVLDRLGYDNCFGDADDRYPTVAAADIAAADPDVVVLPDEPYVFSAGDGPEVFPQLPAALVEGRLLTWYGPSLVDARATLTAALAIGT